MIRAVLWDVDGTLLDFLTAERNAIRKCFEIFHLGECTDEMIRAYSAINLRWWEALERGEKTKPEILLGRFREFFALYGRDVSAAEAFNEEYQVRLGDTIVFCPGALETVRSLRGRAVQYAVTNGTKIAQQRKLARSGLDAMLDGVFISEEVGAEKPDRRFFDAVFASLDGIDPRETLIVGDSLTSDVRGGVNAGIGTVWYNPAGKPRPEDLRIDREIRDLREVLSLV